MTWVANSECRLYWANRLQWLATARLSNRADAVMVTARLLQIVSEDGIDVNRKQKAILENVRLAVRFVVATNELPALVDQTEALLARSLILRFTKTFKGQEDTSLKAKLDAELPGILCWAVAGWKRLASKGRFTEPTASDTLKHELADLLNPVGAFVREKCIVQEGEKVDRVDLYHAWKDWCEREGRNEPGTNEIFGRNLRSVVPSLGDHRRRDSDGNRVRSYVGIRLRAKRTTATFWAWLMWTTSMAQRLDFLTDEAQSLWAMLVSEVLGHARDCNETP